MKFKAGFAQLLQAVRVVDSNVGTKVPNPVVQNILVTAGDNKIVLVTTDFEITTKAVVEAEIVSPGTITVDSRGLKSLLESYVKIAKNLPVCQVVMSLTEEGSMQVEFSDNAEYAPVLLQTIPASDYPDLPQMDNATVACSIETAVLRPYIAKLLVSTAKTHRDTRFKGAHFILTGQKLTLVSTNLLQISIIDHELPEDTKVEKSYIVPNKLLEIVAKQGFDSAPVQMRFSDSMTEWTNGVVTYVASLLHSHESLPYTMALSNQPSIGIRCVRDHLQNVITHVESLSKSGKEEVFSLVVSNGHGRVQVTSGKGVFQGVPLDLVTVNGGQDLAIMVNCDRFTKGLDVLSSEIVTITYFADKKNLSIVGDDEKTFRYITGIIEPGEEEAQQESSSEAVAAPAVVQEPAAVEGDPFDVDIDV